MLLPSLRAIASALAILTCLFSAPVRAESQPTAMIVFDGSGSIWGAIGTEKLAKFDVARSSLRTAVIAAAAKGRLGLTAFGHRRRGDCRDVEVMLAADAGPPERITEALDKLNPKGKGPISLALREAHKSLAADPANSAQASIIVIHDGADNCGADPCAIAAEIAKSPRRVPVHLVSLALERADAQKMSCVAKLTGGRMIEANDVASVDAAIAEAFTLANLAGPPAPAAQAEEPAKPAAPAEKEGPPRLRLFASLASEGPALTTPLRWRLFKAGSKDAILDKAAAEIMEPIEAGDYEIEAHKGLVLTRGPITVADAGVTEVRVPLNAGWIQVSARAARTGETLPDALVTVSRMDDSGEPDAQSREPVWIGRSESEILLPAGGYHVRLGDGLVSSEQTVTLSPGGRAVAEFMSSVGLLELSTQLSETGPPVDGVSYVIAEDDPDSPQGRREVARSAHPQPTFTLPAGTYYITASAGDTEARERIAIGPGETIKKSLVLGVSNVTLATSIEPASLGAGATIVSRVLSLDGEPREVARSTTASATFALPPGRYRIETRAGAENVRNSTEIEVGPGKDLAVTQRIPAGRITVKPAAPSAPGTSAFGAWEVRDKDGAMVVRAPRPEMRTALLAPGRYTVRSEGADRLTETPFEVRPGEDRVIELAQP